jgi:hypothetical protein
MKKTHRPTSTPALPPEEWRIPEADWELPEIDWELPEIDWELPEINWDLPEIILDYCKHTGRKTLPKRQNLYSWRRVSHHRRKLR